MPQSPEPIEANLRPIRKGRDYDNSWSCEAVVNGKSYSGHGGYPMSALARILIDDGVDPNTPLVVTHEGLAGSMRWASLAAAAAKHDRARANLAALHAAEAARRAG